MANSQDERDEKLGRVILTLGWWIFAAKFLIIVTVIAGIVIYFLGKPLWIAPLIANEFKSFTDLAFTFHRFKPHICRADPYTVVSV